MNSLNKVQLIGNLTAVPEVKETPNGQKVANFSIATNRTWKDAGGTKQEQVEYHNIVIWGSLAGIVEKYVTKGQKVYIEGRLQTRSWDDQATGTKRYKTEIVGENVIMLSGKKDGGAHDDESFGQEEETTQAPKKKASPKQEEEINLDDIPF